MLSRSLRAFLIVFAVVVVSSVFVFQGSQSFGADKQKYKYMSNSGCKCHLSKGCFEGEEYKARLHSKTFNKRLVTDEEKTNPECLRCHATAYGMKIKKGKSKYGDFLENVTCEACHGPGEAYVDVKKNYNKKGKDAFKNLLKEDPMMARKVQFDAGLIVAGINKYDTIREQCLECHWEDANDKNKCPKAGNDKETGKPIVMDFKKYFKLDDHRDHDPIDDVLPTVDKNKWKGYIEKDPLFQTKPSNAKH
ncbi:MAG: cytochrome c family protein [Candidatus Scalindua sp.]|nr:cytochrome c family protein [Candidatus Scalindua sp.]